MMSGLSLKLDLSLDSAMSLALIDGMPWFSVATPMATTVLCAIWELVYGDLLTDDQKEAIVESTRRLSRTLSISATRTRIAPVGILAEARGGGVDEDTPLPSNEQDTASVETHTTLEEELRHPSAVTAWD